MKLNPLTARKLKRFRSLRRGYYSFWLLIVLTTLSLFAERSVANLTTVAIEIDLARVFLASALLLRGT